MDSNDEKLNIEEVNHHDNLFEIFLSDNISVKEIDKYDEKIIKLADSPKFKVVR
jgi:hypothetical protein